jgi:endo-alpha-1,4-polygalactosaminidase (GH114 family)
MKIWSNGFFNSSLSTKTPGILNGSKHVYLSKTDDFKYFNQNLVISMEEATHAHSTWCQDLKVMARGQERQMPGYEAVTHLITEVKTNKQILLTMND